MPERSLHARHFARGAAILPVIGFDVLGVGQAQLVDGHLGRRWGIGIRRGRRGVWGNGFERIRRKLPAVLQPERQKAVVLGAAFRGIVRAEVMLLAVEVDDRLAAGLMKVIAKCPDVSCHSAFSGCP